MCPGKSHSQILDLIILQYLKEDIRFSDCRKPFEFPEIVPAEFITFLSTDPKIRRTLKDLHPELFDHRYWQRRQEEVRQGIHGDVFPYPQSLRFEYDAPDSPQALEQTVIGTRVSSC